MTLQEYCLERGMEYLLKEWDESRNIDFTPQQITYASHRIVWWKCQKGHFWHTEVKDRTQRPHQCPYCTGKLPILGETDLVTIRPELATEWHARLNGDLKPEDFTAGSQTKVWWKCGLGHEWQATIENRAVKNNGCPYCSGRKAWSGYNDLATLYPELMEEWHPFLNKGLEPSKIRPGAKKRAWWMCKEGHVWEAFIYSRTSAKRPGCPYCAGNAKKGRENSVPSRETFV